MSDWVDFHDGYVDGVLVSEADSNAHIYLRTVAKEKFVLTLHEVDVLRLEDFRQGNIIFEVQLLSLDQIDAQFVLHAYDYSDVSKDRFDFNAWIETARRKGLRGLEITPSYGCSMSALFKRLDLA